LFVQLQTHYRGLAFSRVNLLLTNLQGPGDNSDLEAAHVVHGLIRKSVEQPRRCIDVSRFQWLVSVEATTSLAEGIERTITGHLPAQVEQYVEAAGAYLMKQTVVNAIVGRIANSSCGGCCGASFRESTMNIKSWWRRPFGRWLILNRQYRPRPLRFPRRYHAPLDLREPPLVSIVTPSFNQGRFLGRTIESVLGQKYPRLEYVVQDGGSTDESVQILQRFEPALTHWASDRDRGQAHAINIGFQRATGEILAYLNADDLLLPGALNYIARFFVTHPDVDVIYGHRIVIDVDDQDIGRWIVPPHDNKVLAWSDFIPQETLFWRRRIWEKIASTIDERFQFAMDWDLLLRFRDAGARFRRLPRFLGAFRTHPQQKSTAQLAIGMQEMTHLRERCHGRAVSEKEICRAVRGYENRHVLCHYLYRFGLVRY
jgi:glycosyltransferase involved in cell wall biosynthesis